MFEHVFGCSCKLCACRRFRSLDWAIYNRSMKQDTPDPLYQGCVFSGKEYAKFARLILSITSRWICGSFERHSLIWCLQWTVNGLLLNMSIWRLRAHWWHSEGRNAFKCWRTQMLKLAYWVSFYMSISCPQQQTTNIPFGCFKLKTPILSIEV